MNLAALRDPYRRSLLVAGALVVAGAGAIVAGWIGVSGTLIVPTQVAFAVSGGMGGFGLAGAGLALVEVQRRRHAAALDRAELAGLAAELGDLAELIVRRGSAAPRAPRRRRRAPLQAR